MTIAELHGKSPWTTSEDFLTADVFTAFRYLPADTGIIGFLRSIPGIAEIIPEPGPSATADFYFWPLGATREPDVLLELTIDGELYHVVVEAKYLSGPSDYDTLAGAEEEPEDAIRWGNQLADQLRELQAGLYTVHYRGARSQVTYLRSTPEHRLLIYLTAHALRPRAVLARSASLCPEQEHHLFWTSWYHVNDYLENNRPRFQDFPFDRVVEDVLQLLTAKAFSTFYGVRRPGVLDPVLPSGRFWQGADLSKPSFQGIAFPPETGLSLPDGHFWQGRKTPLPSFTGVASPPHLRIPQAGGSFWLESR